MSLKRVFKTKFCLIFFLVLLFLGDTLTKIFIHNSINIFAWVSKAIITLLLITNLLYNNKELFIKIALLFTLVFIANVINYQDDFTPKASLFFEYISALLFFNFLTINRNRFLLSKILQYIFIFYISTILIAALLDIKFLMTYNEDRFGYMPLFSSQNEFSFIMISIIVFFYKKWLLKKRLHNTLLLFLSIISASIIGTKVVYIFLILFINYFLIFNFKIKKIISLYAITCVILLTFKNELIILFDKAFGMFAKIYEEKGFIDTVSSLRISYLSDRLICQISNMKFLNYLFGGMNISCITEMSFFDILLFFGLIGSMIYSWLYVNWIFKKLRLDYFGVFFIIYFVVLSFLGGYYFENFSAQVYVISVLFIYYYEPLNLRILQNTGKE